jgi:hypothetical protein
MEIGNVQLLTTRVSLIGNTRNKHEPQSSPLRGRPFGRYPPSG